MANDRLDRALDACLAELRAGGTVEACLASYADLRDELEPLLRAATRLQTDAAVAFNRVGRAETRAHLLAQLDRRPARKAAGGGFGWLGRLAAIPVAAAAIALALFLGLNTLQAPETTEASTTLTILYGDVTVVGPSGESFAARNGMTLSPGDRVVTGDGARAVLTFFDGSTVTLESATDVSILTVAAPAGELYALLNQNQGRTWTHIPRDLGPARIEIDTPVARVQTSDAHFLTSVEDSGRTWVGAATGAVALSSGETKAELKGGFQTSIERQGVFGTPSANVESERDLVVLVSGPVLAVLIAPDESSVGALSSGVPVNQISGASARITGEGFLIRVPDASDGVYQLGFRALSAGELAVTAAFGSDGENGGGLEAFPIGQDEHWGLTFSLVDGQIELGQPQELTDSPRVPKVAAPPLAEERALHLLEITPTLEPTASASVTPSPSPSPSATPTASPTVTPTPEDDAETTPTPTATPAGTGTATATVTTTATATPAP